MGNKQIRFELHLGQRGQNGRIGPAHRIDTEQVIQSTHRLADLRRRPKGQPCPAACLTQGDLRAQARHFSRKGPRPRLFPLKLPARCCGQYRTTATVQPLGKEIGCGASRICIVQPDIGQTRTVRAIGKDRHHGDF